MACAFGFLAPLLCYRLAGTCWLLMRSGLQVCFKQKKSSAQSLNDFNFVQRQAKALALARRIKVVGFARPAPLGGLAVEC